MTPEQYIAHQTRESVQLQFRKGGELAQTDKFYQQLSVLISAMANSGGGCLVYGIEARRHKAAAFSWVDASILPDGWLDELAKSCVEPRLEGVEVLYWCASGNQQQSVVTINVPHSTAVPHRAADKMYYRRADFVAVSMEEYEIRALYQRASLSELDFFALLNTGAVPQLEGGRFTLVNFYPQFLVKNIGSAIEQYYKIELHIPTGLHNPNYSVLQQHFSHFENGFTVFSISNKSPLFQNEIANIFEANICVDYHTIARFEQESILLKLFYTNGIKMKSFKMNETFLYKGQMFSIDDFALPRDYLTE